LREKIQRTAELAVVVFVQWLNFLTVIVQRLLIIDLGAMIDEDDWLGQLHCSPELIRSKHGVTHKA
jgi:hypothetical protein